MNQYKVWEEGEHEDDVVTCSAADHAAAAKEFAARNDSYSIAVGDPIIVYVSDGIETLKFSVSGEYEHRFHAHPMAENINQ